MHPLFTKCTPFTFFGNSFSVTLRNFTNFITILIFLPQGYESSQIMNLLFFSFRRSFENSRIAINTSFRFLSHYGIFMDRVSLLPFDFLARLGTSHIVKQRVPSISKRPIKGCISSNNEPRTKLGYDTYDIYSKGWLHGL